MSIFVVEILGNRVYLTEEAIPFLILMIRAWPSDWQDYMVMWYTLVNLYSI